MRCQIRGRRRTMIISSLLNNWKGILDILLIIAVIVLIFIINPFKFFGSGLKVQNTANLVSQIKEIGQLTTAEYYGEVIASYPESVVEVIDEDDLDVRAEAIYTDFKNTIYQQYRNREEDYNKIQKKYRWKIVRNAKTRKKDEEIVSFVYNYLNAKYLVRKDLLGLDLIIDEVLMYLKKEVRGEKFKEKKFREERKNKRSKFWVDFRRDQIRKELASIKTASKQLQGQDLNTFLNQGLNGEKSFVEFYNWYAEKQLTRRQRKTNLAVIGRGWVKAGFNFGELNERNFIYDEANQAVHFFGFRAEILDNDINPWFIPQEKVPGFEIISADKADFEKMKEVKAYAKQKLAFRATEAGIVEQAQSNGEEALKEFFSLVIGDEIRNVFFHKENLMYLAENILEGDSIIVWEELGLIDSLYKKNLLLIRNERNVAVKKRRELLLSQFISDLRQSRGIYTSSFTGLPFNFYSRNLPIFYRDSVLSKSEIDSVEAMRWDYISVDQPGVYIDPLKRLENKYWFETDLEYINQFNEFLELLKYLHRKDTISFKNNQERIALEKRLKRGIKRYRKRNAQLSYTMGRNEAYVSRSGLFDRYPVKYDSLEKFLTAPLVNWYRDTIQPGGELVVYNHTGYRLNADSSISSTVEMDDVLFTQNSKSFTIRSNSDSSSLLTRISSNYLLINDDTLDTRSKPILYGHTLNQFYDFTDAINTLTPDNSGDSTIFPVAFAATNSIPEIGQSELEIIALRNYLISKNYSYNDIGPISRARRWVGKHILRDSAIQEITIATHRKAVGLKESFNKLLR